MIATSRSESAAALPDRIAFIGLGLIGGSIAMALREAGSRARLAAWTPAARGPMEALRRGVVDEVAATGEAAVEGAGLVILAMPPLAILDAVDALGGPWRSALADQATVTDVASTKARIAAAADAANLRFVGGHPMAGRETAGIQAATSDLFVDRPWVVVPGAHSSGIDNDRVEALATAVGARVIHLEAEEHDAAVAAISHLPLVVSVALVEAVTGRSETAASWALARELAASGWRDMSRLTRGDPEMGAGILATNPQPIAEGLRNVRSAIDAWLEQLERIEPIDAERIRRRLEVARANLEQGG